MTIQGKTIIADEGKVLVRKDSQQPELMIKDIYLGINDSVDNWEEVDGSNEDDSNEDDSNEDEPSPEGE